MAYIGCHDNHSLKVKVEACAECHEGVASVEDLKNVREPSSSQDYDGDGDVAEGVAMEDPGLQAVLLTSMQSYASEVIGTPIAFEGNNFVVAGEDGKPALDKDGKVTRYNKYTARLMKAAYNYRLVFLDAGAFAHGGRCHRIVS